MSIEVIKEVEFESCILQDCKNKILVLKFKGKTKLDLAATKRLVKFGIEFISNEKRKVITDFTGLKNVFDEPSRKFVANDEALNKVKISDAFVIDSYVSSMLAGIYLRLFKPLTITKVFSNFEDTYRWSLTK